VGKATIAKTPASLVTGRLSPLGGQDPLGESVRTQKGSSSGHLRLQWSTKIYEDHYDSRGVTRGGIKQKEKNEKRGAVRSMDRGFASGGKRNQRRTIRGPQSERGVESGGERPAYIFCSHHPQGSRPAELQVTLKIGRTLRGIQVKLREKPPVGRKGD